ncbi:MAG: hypothetical protein K940chlam7_00467 [Chlamydiae bacterium]|nr:hypothetical protein [Chlamydiota bacterium]
MKNFVLVTGVFSLALLSCSDEQEVKVYRLTKDENTHQQASPHGKLSSEQMSLPTMKPSSPGITWTTPEEWEEKEPQGMRAGSFAAEGPNGESIDISVIFLGGDGGGDLPNVNRWRQQISLPPWSLEELDKNFEMVQTPLGEAKVVDFSSEEKLTKEEYYSRTVAAIIPYNEGIWFVKMMGEKDFMDKQKPVFLHFLKTIEVSK